MLVKGVNTTIQQAEVIRGDRRVGPIVVTVVRVPVTREDLKIYFKCGLKVVIVKNKETT